MGIKALKCTTCGADIQLDDSREFGFCQFCGTKLMLVEKVEVKHTGQVSVDGIQSIKERIDNYNILLKNSFLEHNYVEAKKYLDMILQLDPRNSSAWLTQCKILVVKPNKKIEEDIKQFTLSSNNCYKYATTENKEKTSRELTELLNNFLEVLWCVIYDNNLAIVPFDSETLFCYIPSTKYEPFMYIEFYKFLMEECVNAFKKDIDSSYSLDTFNKLWSEFYYRISCSITDYILNSLNNNEAFRFYNDTVNINPSFIDSVTFNQLNNSLWGYRISLNIIFNRLPFKDILKAVGKSIIYVDGWLLKIRCSRGTGRAKSQLTSQQKANIKEEIKQINNKINCL